jgi:DNA-binding response OmpR family regulator
LIVEDDLKMCELLRRGLDEEGYSCVVARDGLTGLSYASSDSFDLILLDVMLPKLNGVSLLRRFRAQGGQTPILMLTARDAVRDQIEGLDAGADDYLTKPFLFDVLLARVRALTRRATPAHSAEIVAGPYRLNMLSREVFVRDEPVNLSKTEFELLAALVRQAGRVVGRQVLIESVWGHDRDVESNTLDTFVRLLRAKLHGRNERAFIETVRGVGYMVRKEIA